MLTSPLPNSNRQARRGSLGDADNFRPCTVAPSLPQRNGSHKGLAKTRTLEPLQISKSNNTAMSDFSAISAISDITEPSLYELDMSKKLNPENSGNAPATSDERWSSSKTAAQDQPQPRPIPRRGRRRQTSSLKQNQSAEDVSPTHLLQQKTQQQQAQPGLHQKQHRRRSLGDAINFAVDTSAPAQPARLDSSHRRTLPLSTTEQETTNSSPKPEKTKRTTPPRKSRRASMTDASSARFQASPLPKQQVNKYDNHDSMIAAFYGYERPDSPHILQDSSVVSKKHRSHRRASMSDAPPARPDSLHKRSASINKTPPSPIRGVPPGSLLKPKARRRGSMGDHRASKQDADAPPTRPDSLHRRTKNTAKTTTTTEVASSSPSINATQTSSGRKLRKKGRSRRASLTHVPGRTTTTR